MKEELLRSVAQPPKVFYAPFGLAILNLLANIVFMAALVLAGRGGYIWIPILAFMLMHGVFILVGIREPHIDTIIAARRNVKARTRNILKEGGNKFAA